MHGDTSTTMLQPLEHLGEICRRHGVLFYTDATASLGGNALESDVTGAGCGLRRFAKMLGGPSGSSPVTLSPAMEAAIRARVNAWSRGSVPTRIRTARMR